MCTLHDLCRHLYHFRDVLKQCCAGTATSHSFDRAAIVNIDKIWPCLGRDLCRSYHVPDIATEKLNTNWPLVFKDIKLLATLGSIADQPFRRNELSIHEVCPTFLAN